MTPPIRDKALILEALLFVQTGPVLPAILAQWLEVGPQEIPGIVERLNHQLSAHSLEVAAVAEGWQLQTRSVYDPILRKALSTAPAQSLSHGAWETLAVVAYRQPVTRLEVEAVRQVGSERTLAVLLERGLIEEKGRKDTPGRPILYGTTQDFLRQFGLNRIEDLPPRAE